MTPIVNGLEETYGDEITFERLNAAEREVEALQLEVGVRGHPSFAIVDESGQIAATFVGPQSEEALEEGITAVLP